ncbi:MAG: hydroxymethylbilane synthase [Candidatus Eremiobacteraeota bacterium]|nr:hydroxymethylbilane synthase [Candidatus Eremiobacteraeota bacterium]
MLPISLRPNGRRAVIVGGGDVAARKAESLAGAGFALFVVAERIDERLHSFLKANRVAFAQRRYQTPDLDDAAIVVVATDDSNLNAQIVADAKAAHALVCDATDPARGDFTMPATRHVGELTISVDSDGNAPAFSRRVVEQLADGLDASYADALRTLARMRSYAIETFAQQERAPILRALAMRPIAELARPPVTAICATRRSALAMVQSRTVAVALAKCAVVTTLLGVTTTGDRDRRTPIEQLGEVNVFVKELEAALREHRADFAVHSCKDLAGSMPDDMRITAISAREDARDAFCSERYCDFESLPAGAVVGTSSPRRRAALTALRPDLRYEPLRGNVDTRLRKLAGGQYDAIVLAVAGLERLGAGAKYVVPFPIDRVVPAVGQGALAVEMRAGDDRLYDLVRDAVNDPQSELCIVCERAALRAMRAGCSTPLGIHAHFAGETMIVDAFYAPAAQPPAKVRVERTISTLEAAQLLGEELAQQLKSSMWERTVIEE